MDKYRLDGRCVVISGFSSGIGRATAVACAERGASVIGLDISEEQGLGTCELVRAAGGVAAFVRCDIGDAGQIADAFTTLDAADQRPDILVNNAALFVERTYPQDTPLTSWETTLRVNLTGYFLCAQQLAIRLIARQAAGSIVNVSSINGQTALGRGNLAYSVSKAGINQLTRELAVEWAPHQIRVNAVLPCQTRTKKLDELLAHEGVDSQAVTQRALAGIPLGRFGEPEEIAAAIVFLAADASSLITGALLPTDGGNLALNAGGSTRW